MTTTPQKPLSKAETRLAERMSLTDAEALVNELAELHARAATHEDAINVRMDEISGEIDALRARYQPGLAPLLQARDAVVAERDAKLLRLQAWAEANKGRLFSVDARGKRSLAFLRGVVGFRLSKASVELDAGKDPTAIAAVLGALRWARAFVTRPLPTVNKQAVLDAREQLQGDAVKLGLLADAGLRIVQTDGFYFQPKVENPDAAKLAA